MDGHLRPGQDAHVNAADARDVRKSRFDAGDHHADGIHVGGDHHRGPLAVAGAFLKSVQGADAADAGLVNERPPLLLDKFGNGRFVPR